MLPEVGTQMAVAQAGNTSISACTLDRNTIPNPKTMFSPRALQW